MRIGLVGAGYWGSNIARALSSINMGRLVAVHDIVYERALELASRHGAVAYRDLDTMLERGELDAVIVAVSADRLYEVARRVIERGIDVFIEKPVAMTLEEVRDLRAVAEERGVVATPGFIMRFDPVTEYIRGLIRERGIDPVYIYIQRSGRRAERYRGIDILLDLGVHDIDLLFYLLDRESLRVLDACVSELQGDTAYTAYIDYGGGTAYITSNPLPLVKIRKIIVDLDSEVYIEGDFVLSEVRIIDRKHVVSRETLGSSREPLVAELEAFLEKVSGRSSRAPSLVDAERVHEVIKDIVSIARSRAVKRCS